MKKVLSIICIFVCCTIMGQTKDNIHSYYYGLYGSKISLALSADKLAIRKDATCDKEDFLQNLAITSEDYIWEWKNSNLCVLKSTNGQEASEMRLTLAQKRSDMVFLPVYIINNNVEAILSPEIVVEKKTSDLNIDAITMKYGLALEHDGRCQIYSVPVDSDVIKIANEIYETGQFAYAYPHFWVPFHLSSHIPNDTYFQYQLAFHNIGQTLPNGHFGNVNADINAPEAWDLTTGSNNVVIAVFDSGVTSDHPDLPNSRQIRLQGSNFGSGNPNNPSPVWHDNHGNACAGAIAATMDNNEGVAGVAPNCRIMPLRWDEDTYDTGFEQGIDMAVDSGANIISCSFGASYMYTSPAIVSAIERAIAHNVVVLFAAGNGSNHENNYNHPVDFPANADVPYLITVGASDRYDHVANYSPISPQIDFVAPSHRAYDDQIQGETHEMWTIDIPGNYGYNPIPYSWANSLLPVGSNIPSSGTNYLAYTGCFGGTSYACPVVAGVVALMLSVNPNLTPKDVFNILKETSAKVGGYTYTDGRCDEMGYGRVDAYAAVYAAKYKYIVGPDYFCDTTCFSLLNVPEGTTCQWTVHLSDAMMGSMSIVSGQGTQNVCVRYLAPLPFRSNGDHEEYENAGGRPNLDFHTYVTVTVVDNATSTPLYTVRKDLRPPTGATPIITTTDSTPVWYLRTSRTFFITNISSVPDSAVQWTVKRYEQIVPPTPQVVHTNYYYGAIITYNPPTIFHTRRDTLVIYATNLAKECEPKQSNIMRFILRSGKPVLNGTQNGDQLDVNIYEEREETQYVTAHLDENCSYTLELWNNIYGRMRTKAIVSATEQMDIHNIPKGVYVLTLKENGTIIAQTKVLIQ